MIPTADEMGDAIWANAQKLLDAGILEEPSRNVALRLRGQLKKIGNNQNWEICVPREDGFVFKELVTDAEVIYQPIVSVDRIATSPNGRTPFSRLDISLQLSCKESDNHARWHFDMANMQKNGQYQHGPLFHMQYGGHIPGIGNHWISLPRWAHAPMDLVLLLEAVAANFYTEAWNSSLRQDSSWCEHISQSETMCLSNYVSSLSDIISTRSRTVLGSLWANA